MTTTQTLAFESPDQGEEAARAALYGMLASLFYAPPPQDMLDALAGSQTAGDGPLERAWNDLTQTCGHARCDAVRDEYEVLFIGVGKPEVMLYGSYYLSGFLMEKPLAELRADLARLGLERAEAVAESEDHVAALCEAMHCLICSDDPLLSGLSVQKEFFGTHLQPWAGALCDALQAHPQARFYSRVAGLARAFFEVEAQAFDMA